MNIRRTLIPSRFRSRRSKGEDAIADEPDNITLVMLREIRAKQDEHSQHFERVEGRLEHVEKQLGNLTKVVTYSLG